MKTLLFSVVALVFACGEGVFGQGRDPLVEEGPRVFRGRGQEEFAATEARLNTRGKAMLATARQERQALRGATFEVGANEVMNEDMEHLLGLKRIDETNPEMEHLRTSAIQSMQSEIEADQKALNIEPDFSFMDLELKDLAQRLFGYGCTWNASILTPVENQMPCGTCWAFAATATWEHSYRKIYGTGAVPDVSEQDMISCGVTSSGADAGACEGGNTDRALDYMKAYRAATEASYPYTGNNAPCQNKPKVHGAYYWSRLAPGDKFPTLNEVKAMVLLYGAVATYMKAGVSTFIGYGGGVYNGYPSTDSTWDVDHAVTIVGWCDDKNAWIIKNSWGPNWGPYGGYAYVDYNTSNIGRYVYYVYPRP